MSCLSPGRGTHVHHGLSGPRSEQSAAHDGGEVLQGDEAPGGERVQAGAVERGRKHLNGDAGRTNNANF